jgi:hypothetical protein
MWVGRELAIKFGGTDHSCQFMLAQGPCLSLPSKLINVNEAPTCVGTALATEICRNE